MAIKRSPKKRRPAPEGWSGTLPLHGSVRISLADLRPQFHQPISDEAVISNSHPYWQLASFAWRVPGWETALGLGESSSACVPLPFDAID
jgi:hypothetical protein